MTKPVIIVGAGPVGLGAALELSRCDVPSIVVEQHDSTSSHPKARNLNTRTMEIARGWGRVVYQRLRGIDSPPGWKSPIRICDAIVGEQLGRIETQGFEGPGPLTSPALPVMSSQDLIEPILRDAAQATGLADLRFGHRVTSVVAGAGGDDGEAVVEVHVDGTGETYTLAGAALVAADGANSTVRRQLGVGLNGEQAINHFVNCYFLSDIESHAGMNRGVMFFVANPEAAGALQPLDARGRWLCQIAVPPHEWVRELWDVQRVQRWVRGAVGVATLDVEVKSIGLWQINATVADRLVCGRVVLCGDAAHQLPPTGGLGLNTGLQGMHNAMWKLALCVRGVADWSLLQTYEDERRSPAHAAITRSLDNARNVARLAAAAYGSSIDDTAAEEILELTRRYGNHSGIEFGTTYDSRAVVGDGTAPPEVDDVHGDYVPSATPGRRAPHVWLGIESQPMSTLDLFGPGFTMLTGPRGAAWRRAAEEAAEHVGVPIAGYTIGDPGLADQDGAFVGAYEIGSHGAVLVRPDGHVAWRCTRAPSDDSSLVLALERILGRQA